MTIEPDLDGFVETQVRGFHGRDAHPLRIASTRIAEFREGRSAFKARDLVGLLLSHGARAYRASQPRAAMRLRVRSPAGAGAVRMRLS